MEAFVWLILFVLLLVIEIISLGLTTIWFAFGALVAFILALIGVDFAGQIIIFVIVSFATLLLVRPLADKYLNKNTIKTNVEAMAGKTGVVTEEINNVSAKGRITVDGMEWTARSEDDSEVIAEGEIVTILKIEGVKAIVK